MSKIIVNTSYDDLLSSFKCSIEHITIKQLEENIEFEKKRLRRKSVIGLLQRVIKMKNKKAKSL